MQRYKNWKIRVWGICPVPLFTIVHLEMETEEYEDDFLTQEDLKNPKNMKHDN